MCKWILQHDISTFVTKLTLPSGLAAAMSPQRVECCRVAFDLVDRRRLRPITPAAAPANYRTGGFRRRDKCADSDAGTLPLKMGPARCWRQHQEPGERSLQRDVSRRRAPWIRAGLCAVPSAAHSAKMPRSSPRSSGSCQAKPLAASVCNVEICATPSQGVYKYIRLRSKGKY